jgi:hypothetical protein
MDGAAIDWDLGPSPEAIHDGFILATHPQEAASWHSFRTVRFVAFLVKNETKPAGNAVKQQR